MGLIVTGSISVAHSVPTPPSYHTYSQRRRYCASFQESVDRGLRKVLSCPVWACSVALLMPFSPPAAPTYVTQCFYHPSEQSQPSKSRLRDSRLQRLFSYCMIVTTVAFHQCFSSITDIRHHIAPMEPLNPTRLRHTVRACTPVTE